MEPKNYNGAVPENHRGNQLDAASDLELQTIEHAKLIFGKAKNRLLDVNRWTDIAGELGAEFKLTDAAGQPKGGLAQEGLLLRIDVPGPGTESGHGFDWVRIEKIDVFESEEVQSLAMRVRPAKAPGSEDDAPSHFYSETSTSTFTVTREQQKVTAAIYDRNLEANKESQSLLDKIRNVITGAAGQTIFSKVQWELLADGLLSQEVTDTAR